MHNQNEHINLIIKYLAGETNRSEEALLHSWISQSADNKKLFESYKKIWSLSQKEIIPEVEKINIDDEWVKFKQKVSFITQKHSVKEKKNNFYFLRIAVIALILISLGIVTMYVFNEKKQKIVALNEVKEAKLPDNTEVSINKNTELVYDKNFNKKERKVELKGEAFFKVVKNREKPFIVKTESFYVEVLGTQFYVNTNFDKRQVVVKEGTVAVYRYKNKYDKVILHAGDKAIFDDKQNKIRKVENFDANYIAWKTKIFNFQNQNLVTVLKTLENAYCVHFEFVNPELKKCRITVSFKNQSIDEVLNVLRTTFDNINFRKEKNIVYIDGKSCK